MEERKKEIEWKRDRKKKDEKVDPFKLLSPL